MMETILLNPGDAALLACSSGAARALSACDPLDLRGREDPRIAPTAIHGWPSRPEKAGLAQRVATLDVLLARPSRRPAGSSGVAIRVTRGAVERMAEADTVEAAADAAARSGSQPNKPVIEVHGHCTRCAPHTDPTRRAQT